MSLAPSSIGVNTSAFIRNQLGLSGASGTGLYLQVGEDLATRHMQQINSMQEALSGTGVRWAIEEVTGSLSSFNVLRSLQPAYVKLRPSLVRHLGQDKTDLILIRAIVEIARDLQIRTIATEVADTGAFSQLMKLSIDLVSGSAAGPTEPVDAWMEGAVMRGLD